jgi:hypothetical protein
LNSKDFDVCLSAWRLSNGYDRFWPELAEQLGYANGESLRWKFKNERKKRGIKKDIVTGIVKTNVGKANVGVFDLEFSALEVVLFELFNQNVSIDQILNDSFLLSWSAKYLNDPKVYSDVLTSEEALEKNDYRIVKSIWDFLNGCDILIGHNIIGFDEKKLATRFLVHGLPPIKKHFSIDTLLVARNNFAFTSNKLKYINKFLNIKQKLENEGITLWISCMRGDANALQKMLDYNQGDVLSVEETYIKLRPFIKGHPSLALYFDTNEMRCPNCGSENVSDMGEYYTPAGLYKSFRCECGAICRSKQNDLSKDKRKSLLVN